MKLGRLYRMFNFLAFIVFSPLFAQDSTVTLRFGGDCLLAEHYERSVCESLDIAFRGFELLRSADLAMVNLECPVTVRGEKVTKPFNFRMHPKFLTALKKSGIDIVNIANNHIYDYGSIGLFDTIVNLDSVGILHVGAGKTHEEAHRPVVLNVKGKKVGFLGYYGGGEAPPARRSKPGVAERAVSLIKKDVAKLKRDSVDFIIVNLHWGTEKATEPDTSQVGFAHALIDAGVDLIVGHHPHVLQGIERYRNGVIAYSLGNFIFGGKNLSSYDTALLEVKLFGTEAEYTLVPIRVTDWRANALEGSSADSILTYVASISNLFPRSIFNFQEKN